MGVDERQVLINELHNIICGERITVYGKPEDSFRQIAKFWSAYLGIDLSGLDVARMMVLLKIGRSLGGATDKDTLLDAAGYSLLAQEMLENDSRY